MPVSRALALLTLAIVTAIGATMSRAAEPLSLPAYQITSSVPLGVPDKWDFLTFDPSSNRVYVSHRTKIDVVDVAQGKVVGEVPGLGESHSVVVVPSLGRGYADDAAAKDVVIFDLKSLTKIATVPVGVDADAMVFDPATIRVFVMNSDGNSVTAIDAAKNVSLKTVALGGAPEMAVADGHGKLFIAVASTNEIVVFGTKTLGIAARWPVAECEKPHGLAMDEAANRLFVSCANARMLVVDAGNGKVLADIPIGKGTDAAAFDPVRKLAFSSNGEGTLSVISERDSNTFEALGDVKTAPGARTMALDPATARVFLVTADIASIEPPTVTEAKPHLKFVPGSVKMLIMETRR